MDEDLGYVFKIIALMGLIFLTFGFAFSFLQKAEVANSETIVVECDIVDKDIDTRRIFNGKVMTTVRSYHLTIDIDGIKKEVNVTQSQYNEIEVPSSAMFTLYYDSKGKLIKTELY